MCLSRSGVRSMSGLSRAVEHERRDGVDELGLEQLDRRHLGEREAPRVPAAEVDLLQVLVEPALREQVGLRLGSSGEQRGLGQLGRVGQADDRSGLVSSNAGVPSPTRS